MMNHPHEPRDYAKTRRRCLMLVSLMLGSILLSMAPASASRVKTYHVQRDPLDVASAITAARAAVDNDVTVQAEIDSLEQLAPALDARPDILLLDNMTTEDLALAVTIRNNTAPDVLLEASGGINLESLAAVAATQVDRISVGALTHSIPNWDVAFDWVD